MLVPKKIAQGRRKQNFGLGRPCSHPFEDEDEEEDEDVRKPRWRQGLGANT